MRIQVTFLGTGTSSGVPMIGCQCRVCQSPDPKDKRLRASVLVEIQPDPVSSAVAPPLSQVILIDAGPDFRQQMLTYQVHRLDAILLTHEHKDHVAGLDDVRAFNFLSGTPMPVYAEQRVQTALRKEYDYVFAEQKYPGAPEIELHTIDEKPFFIGGTPVIPVRAMHGPLPILGFRIGSFGYLTDAKTIDYKELDKFRGVEVFVVSTVQRKTHRTHFALSQAMAVAEFVGARQTYLTHLSHCIEPHTELAAWLPRWIQPAYDGLTLSIPG